MAKKMSKADTYPGYGIEYDSKTNKIRTPFGNWVKPLLVDGNTKVGKAAKTWSIMHGNETYTADDFQFDDIKAVFEMTGCESVKGSCNCHCDGCYCDSGNYTRYSTTYRSNLFKLILARMFPDFVKRAIIAQIKADKVKQVRIHASGDFFGDGYITVWHEIINECMECVFWTYTKNHVAEKAFKDLPNVSIVPSITPCGINYGTCTELLEMRDKLTKDGYRVHICACGTDYEKHCSECHTGCKAIGRKCDYVLFIKHSTADYKAGAKDPEAFAAIVDIIRNQEN